MVDLSRCNGCQICQDVCQEQAIVVSESVHPKKIIEISVHSQACSTCGNQYLSWDGTDEVCFICDRKGTSIF